jgi:hypothetical protein
MEITLYLVGVDEEDAITNLLFDSYETAEDFANDNPGTNIYTVDGTVDYTTIQRVVEYE